MNRQKPCYYSLEGYPPPENSSMTGFSGFLNSLFILSSCFLFFLVGLKAQPTFNIQYFTLLHKSYKIKSLILTNHLRQHVFCRLQLDIFAVSDILFRKLNFYIRFYSFFIDICAGRSQVFSNSQV